MKIQSENLEETKATPEHFAIKDFKGKFKILRVIAAVFAIAYIAHASCLWMKYGPPSGFCTQCFIYWGEHRILGGGWHYVEHAPLQFHFFDKGE